VTAVRDGITVLEIGTGPGGMTRALLAEGEDRVLAVGARRERHRGDNEIPAALPGQLQIGAAMRSQSTSRLISPANLRALSRIPPPNSRRRLLVSWFRSKAVAALVRQAHAHVSALGAERIVAKPGSEDLGRLSVGRAGARGDGSVRHRAPRLSCPDEVTSSLVRLDATRTPASLRAPCARGVTESRGGRSDRAGKMCARAEQIGVDPIPLLEKVGSTRLARAAGYCLVDGLWHSQGEITMTQHDPPVP